MTVNVQLEQTGDYISWPAAHQPDADGLVTIPVTLAARSTTATFTLDTVDDAVSENAGSVTATILADTNGKYVAATSSAVTTTLLDNDPPIISVEAVTAVVTEGASAQYRFTREGDTRISTRVGLYVTGMPKIMTEATKAIALTSDNEDQSRRLFLHGTWVDYILEFAAGETEKVLSLTTEADSVNEGDGWLAVSILQRTSVPYSIGTGRVRVHVEDDDIPTVSLTMPVGPTELELSADGTTWEGTIGEGIEFTYSSTCTGVTEFSGVRGSSMGPATFLGHVLEPPSPSTAKRPSEGWGTTQRRSATWALTAAGHTVTQDVQRIYVGPENGVLEITLVPLSEFEVIKPAGGLRHRKASETQPAVHRSCKNRGGRRQVDH